MPYRHVLDVPAMGSAVRIARETTELVLVECGVGLRHPSVGPALLILSELVTNAVRHAAALSPTITVTYAHGPGAFAFAVHDRHPYRPALFGAYERPGQRPGHGGRNDDGARRHRRPAHRYGRARQGHLDHFPPMKPRS